MSVEILTLTNAKTQSFTDTGGCFDGLTASQINGALAGCDPIGELILRRKYLNPKETGKGYLMLFNQSQDYLRNKGKYPKRLDAQAIIGRLVELYLEEDTQHNVCPTCRGRTDDKGVTVAVNHRGLLKRCRRCGGGGKISWTDKQRSLLIDVKQATFSRVYKDVYRLMSHYLDGVVDRAEKQAEWHVMSNLQQNCT